MIRILRYGLLLKLRSSLIVLLDCLLHLMIAKKLVQKLRLLNLIKLCLIYLILEQCGCWPSCIQWLILHQLLPLFELLEFGTVYRFIQLFSIHCIFLVFFYFWMRACFVWAFRLVNFIQIKTFQPLHNKVCLTLLLMIDSMKTSLYRLYNRFLICPFFHVEDNLYFFIILLYLPS